MSPYIVCLIPTRGDRPVLLSRAIEMLAQQTLCPVNVIVIDDDPVDINKKDITWRYRNGLERVMSQHPNVELILFIEDDDWYSEDYIKTFYDAWLQAGKPELFGIGETYYYHIGLRKIYHEKHVGRASAFCTGITPAGISKMNWPNDDYSYVDFEFWKQLNGLLFIPNKPVAVGIKGHKVGTFFGGSGHYDSWAGYKHDDQELTWISNIIDKPSIDFYFKKICNGN